MCLDWNRASSNAYCVLCNNRHLTPQSGITYGHDYVCCLLSACVRCETKYRCASYRRTLRTPQKREKKKTARLLLRPHTHSEPCGPCLRWKSVINEAPVEKLDFPRLGWPKTLAELFAALFSQFFLLCFSFCHYRLALRNLASKDKTIHFEDCWPQSNPGAGRAIKSLD